MIVSMTGYSEKILQTKTIQVKIAVKTLNHRYFDWSYRGTPLGDLENVLREACQRRIKRGRIEVTVDLSYLDDSGWEVSIHAGLLQKIMSSLDKTSRRIGKPVDISPEIIFRVPQLMDLKRRDLSPDEKIFLQRGFEKTLSEVIKARSREGRDTIKQFHVHLARIRKSLSAIKKLSLTQQAAIRQKLRQRWQEINGSLSLSEGRLEEEAAILAQRADITEEILRLGSHIKSFSDVLRKEGGEPAGKMLDFMAQEMAREINTLGSKSQDIDITRDSLIVKGEVESLRQHIQNIE